MLGVFSRAGFVRGRLSGCRFLATISTSTTTGTAIIPSSGSSSTRRWGRTGAVSWINPRLQPGEDRRVMSRIPARPASSPPSTAPPASPSGDPGWRPPPWRRTSSPASPACPAACSENPELVFDGFRQQVLTCPRPWRQGLGIRLQIIGKPNGSCIHWQYCDQSGSERARKNPRKRLAETETAGSAASVYWHITSRGQTPLDQSCTR